jgi:hypothetical protein
MAKDALVDVLQVIMKMFENYNGNHQRAECKLKD